MPKIANATLDILRGCKNVKRNYNKLQGGEHIVTFTEVNAIFKRLREILATLDKIYHMLEEKE